jgi:putative PIN family toxin of toxin-antitoxin system
VISAVFDTNIIVSGTIVAGGIPDQLLQAARAGRFTLVTSHVIVAEVVRALSRDRVRRKYRIAGDDIERVRQLLEQELASTPITVRVVGVATHPDDDLILATAVSARADYLVTGDAQLQRLGTYQGVAIVSPRRSLEILHSGASSA